MKVELFFLVFIEIFIMYKQGSVKSCVVTELVILNQELIFNQLIFDEKIVPRKLEMISKYQTI
jgi:hypothetical protein